ncbi:MAG: hypothetical protein IJ324_11960 [Lachnospiraceae bacterium]|nr:hypothetical protein [Lachnospiraceae bacterium]
MQRWFISLVGNERYLYWMTEKGGHFMREELKTGNVEYIRPRIKNSLGDVVRSAILCIEDNRAFFVVNGGEKILILDLETDCVKEINIQCANMHLDMFSFSKVIGDEIVLIPTFYHEILFIDINTGVVSRENILKIESESIGFKQAYALNCYFDNNEVIFCSTITQELITYSLTQKKVLKTRKLPSEIGDIVDFVISENRFFFLSSNGIVIEWTITDNRIIFRTDDRVEGGYRVLHMVKDDLWLLPFFEEDIYKVSLKDGSYEQYKDYPMDYRYTAPKTMGKFFKKYSVGEKTYFAMHSGNYMFFINDITGVSGFEKMVWPDLEQDLEELDYQKRKKFSEQGVSLKFFLKYIVREGDDIEMRGRVNNGRTIWNSVKGM